MERYQNFKDFDEIRVGDTCEFSIIISKEIHDQFSKLSGDFSPVHCDEAFSKKTRFHQKIGYANLLHAFLSRLYGQYLPGGSSICIRQEARYLKPFFINDSIRVIGEVVKKSESTHFVEIKTEMFRHSGECIFSGIGTVQVIFNKNEFLPLYDANGVRIYQSDFIDAFRKLGIVPGDVLFIHSDISVFGRLCNVSRELLLDTLTDALQKCVGNNGTLIVPTFSYSFCKNEVFDVQNTRSTVGILTEHFRKRPDVIRSMHPIFSVAVWGKDKEFFSGTGKDSFDEDSIFGRIHKRHAKILFLGATIHSCTFLHYIEQAANVPYRFIKKFTGTVRRDDEIFPDECTYFVRPLDRDITLDTTLLESHLKQHGYLQEETVGFGKIQIVDAAVLFDEGRKQLGKDITFFLKK